VIARAFIGQWPAVLIGEAAQHYQLITERFERREDWRKLEVGAFAHRSPVRHHHAIRMVHHGHAAHAAGRGLALRRQRRDHAVQ